MNFIKNIINDEIKEHKEAVKTLNKNKLKLEKANILKYILFTLLTIFYIWQYFFDKTLYNYATKTLSMNPLLYIFIFDLITLLLAFILFYKEIKNGFKNFKENIISYIEYFTLTLVIFLIIDLLIGLFCNFIVGDIPDNQTALVNISNILYLFFGSCIYAPIVEEIIFRGLLRKFIKNKYAFIIISSILFGLLHVLGSGSLIQYIYILYYGASGVYFSYVYSTFNNISFCMFIHFFINFFGTLSILIH